MKRNHHFSSRYLEGFSSYLSTSLVLIQHHEILQFVWASENLRLWTIKYSSCVGVCIYIYLHPYQMRWLCACLTSQDISSISIIRINVHESPFPFHFIKYHHAINVAQKRDFSTQTHHNKMSQFTDIKVIKEMRYFVTQERKSISFNNKNFHFHIFF